MFAQDWYDLEVSFADDLNDQFWSDVLRTRDAVNQAIEAARNNKEVGGSLEASAALYVGAALQATLAKLGDELRFTTLTSAVSVAPLIRHQKTRYATKAATLRWP